MLKLRIFLLIICILTGLNNIPLEGIYLYGTSLSISDYRINGNGDFRYLFYMLRYKIYGKI
jgi:hypothetical protein